MISWADIQRRVGVEPDGVPGQFIRKRNHV